MVNFLSNFRTIPSAAPCTTKTCARSRRSSLPPASCCSFDEVYEHIVFDGAPHRSVMTAPLLAAAAIGVSSLGKTLRTTG